VVFYVTSRASEGGHAFTAGGLGLSWAIAGASLFTALGARGVDQRLVFDGYRPVELLGARLLLLDAAGVVLSALFATLLLLVSGTPHVDVLVLALVLVALVAVPLGLVLAVLVPHELEATLLLIGLIGIEMILPSESATVGDLPLGGPQELLDRAAGKPNPVAVTTALGRSAVWVVALTVVAAYRPVRPLSFGIEELRSGLDQPHRDVHADAEVGRHRDRDVLRGRPDLGQSRGRERWLRIVQRHDPDRFTFDEFRLPRRLARHPAS